MQTLPKFTPEPDVAPRKSVYDADMAAFAATLPADYEGDPSSHPDAPWRTYYAHDYVAIFRDIAAQPEAERGRFTKSVIRKLCLSDLFFIVYFIMDVPVVNKAFGVERCHEIESGGLNLTQNLYIWARGHLKSTIITIALTIKRILNNPECTTLIFSYKKPAAEKFLDAIRKTLEKEIMWQCFPDVLYEDPNSQAPSWSLQNGIRVKRKSVSRKENTVEACGLVEGQQTGGHFDHLMGDDFETFDIAKSPDQMNLCFDAFEMVANLGLDGSTTNVVGTYYSHIGPLIRVRDKQTVDGKPMYSTSIRPATHDGTRNGRPVFLSQARLDELKTTKFFDSQILCQPTPVEVTKLDSRMLKMIHPSFMPKERYKFLIIDQAGGTDTRSKATRKGDKWFIGIISVRPQLDDRGASDCYLEQFVADEMTDAEAINTIIDMYLGGVFIRAVGVEKVGLSTTEIHIKDALKVRGRRISEETRTLILLRPGGRSTEERVEAALQWPLCNGKLYVSTEIPEEQRVKLISEMDLFPFYHPDIINGWAYAYDIIKTYRFDTDGRAKPVSVGSMMASSRVRGEF